MDLAEKHSQKQDIIEPVVQLILIIKPDLIKNYRCISHEPRRWQKINSDYEWKSIDECDIHTEITTIINIIQTRIMRIYKQYITYIKPNEVDIKWSKMLYYLHPVIAKTKFINKVIKQFAEMVFYEE